MLKKLLMICVFLFVLPKFVSAGELLLNNNVDISKVLEENFLMLRDLVQKENSYTENSILFFEDSIKNGNEEYYARISLNSSNGTIISFTTAYHLFKPEKLYRVVFLDVYEIDYTSIGEKKIVWEHYIKAYIIFYDETGDNALSKVKENIDPVEVFEKVRNKFKDKLGPNKNFLKVSVNEYRI